MKGGHTGSSATEANLGCQYINELFLERRPLETVGINFVAKVLETVGLSTFLVWWGTRTNPFD